MQENKTLRIWQWAVLLLVLCNIALILTIWLKPHRHGRGGETARNYVIASLKFSDAQVKEYDLLIADHRSAMDRLQKKGMAYRMELFAGLKGNVRENIADSLAQLIATNQKQIELVTYHHFEQVRMICTDVQKPEFDKIIGGVIKLMNGPGHGGPPPHDKPDNTLPGNGTPPPPPDGGGPPDGHEPPPEG